MAKGARLECGCVEGYYWCAKHDIYTPQGEDRRNLEQREYDTDAERKRSGFWEWLEEQVPDSCTCFLSAPCSFCVKDTEGK